MTNQQIANLPTLAPGTTSNDVKTLQLWLIQNGYSIPDGATGYYGDQTKAAVTKWQTDAKMDTQGNPGYFGPLSKTYVSSLGNASTNTKALPSSSSTTTTTTTPAPTSPMIGIGSYNGLPLNRDVDGTFYTTDLNKPEGQQRVNLGTTLPSGTTLGTYGQSLQASGALAPGATPGVAPGATGPLATPITGKAFQGSDAYKALSAEDQQFINDAFAYITYGTEEDARRFATAVKQAKDLADPYFKSKLAISAAQVGVKVALEKNDYNAAKEIIERTQKELLEDVTSSKGFLSLEHQSDLAREAKDFGMDLLDIADSAAEKGITFATGARSRVESEQRRAQTYGDVVQSSTREFNFKVNELENRAARGDVSAKAELDRITKTKDLNLKNIGLGAEQILGSANLTPIEGYTPVGGITGSIEEEKERTIMSDIKGGIDLQKNLISYG